MRRIRGWLLPRFMGPNATIQVIGAKRMGSPRMRFGPSGSVYDMATVIGKERETILTIPSRT